MKSDILSVKNQIKHSFYALLRQKFFIVSITFAIGIGLAYLILNRKHFDLCSSTFYDHIIGPLITMLTFFTALLLGVYNIFSEWKNSLEKRLTVFFIYYYPANGSDVGKDSMQNDFIKKHNLKPDTPYCLMICEEASLSDEGDIRAWGQQLGRQIEDGTLGFYPFYTLGNNREVVRVMDSAGVKHLTRQYVLFVFLEKIPNAIIMKDAGILATDNYDDTPINSKKKFVIVDFKHSEYMNYTDYHNFIREKLAYIDN